MPTLNDAIQYIRMGNRERGRQILEQVLETDENNEGVWLWLSAVVESDEDREICFENVLALDPNNAIAQKGLNTLRAGTFNSSEMIGELLDQEDQGGGATFLDDFVTAEEEEELVLPSSMSKSSSKPKGKAKRGGGINVRLIILIVLVLVVVLALGAVAAYSMFLGGGGDTITAPEENPPTQPAQEAAPPTTDTSEPTAIPTEMPTPTATRLQLPTPIPPQAPTPTATRVVSPTPSR